MIKIAIVEDEEVYIKILKEYIARYCEERDIRLSVVVFPDGAEIADDYPGDIDIILMDIKMKYMDGMTAAEKIRELDKNVVIMFITNMTDYAIRGYEIDALDYVLKPVEYFSFSQKLNKAISRVSNRHEHFIGIPVENGTMKLRVEDIFFVESMGHTIIYHTKDGELSSRGTMKTLEQKLGGFGFFRNGKSYLVNLRHVDGVKDGQCLIAGKQLAIGRQVKKAFMEALLNYIKEQ